MYIVINKFYCRTDVGTLIIHLSLASKVENSLCITRCRLCECQLLIITYGLKKKIDTVYFGGQTFGICWVLVDHIGD